MPTKKVVGYVSEGEGELPPRVIGYIRVSTDKQVDKISPEAQTDRIQAWAKSNDYSEVHIRSDLGMSGGRMGNRHGLQETLEMLQRGDVLVVYSLSRLSRSIKDTILIAEMLSKKGVDLVSLTEKIDTTSAAGKCFFHIIAAFNQFFRDQTSEVTKNALRFKRHNGFKTGGMPPYGYLVGEGGKLGVNSDEMAIVQIIMAMARGGMGPRQIANMLNTEGYTKRGGGEWHPQSVKNVIQYQVRIAQEQKEKE